jgi:hypothetical protein
MDVKWVGTLATLLVLLGCTAGKIASQTSEDTSGFPLSKGNYWLYKGTVRWTKPNTKEVREKTFVWKMEVVRTLQREYVYGAVVRGFPGDLTWYEEGRAPSDCLILRVGSGNYYHLTGERMESALKRFAREGDLGEGMVLDADQFLDLPLRTGKIFGEVRQITRQDRSYCWVVEGEDSIELKGVKGVTSPSPRTQYSLIYKTRPDHTRIEFVPGIGITSYRYVHHGTVSEVDLKLSEYHQGNP